MIIYSVGDGSKRGRVQMEALGMGRLLTPQHTWSKPPRGIPWALDNGAFGSWKNGTPFDEAAFLKAISKVPADNPPTVAILPDIVAGGEKSLSFSLSWVDRVPPAWPWYLAVQDGMTESLVGFCLIGHLRQVIKGVFVGGTRTWKRANAERWIRFAHLHALKVHVGGMGTFAALAWCRRIGADSVDSTNFGRNDAYNVVEAVQKQRILEVRA